MEIVFYSDSAKAELEHDPNWLRAVEAARQQKIKTIHVCEQSKKAWGEIWTHRRHIEINWTPKKYAAAWAKTLAHEVRHQIHCDTQMLEYDKNFWRKSSTTRTRIKQQAEEDCDQYAADLLQLTIHAAERSYSHRRKPGAFLPALQPQRTIELAPDFKPLIASNIRPFNANVKG